MKRIYINIILIGVLVFISTGCSDFFETDNDTQLRGDDYVKEVGELYSGFNEVFGMLERTIVESCI